MEKRGSAYEVVIGLEIHIQLNTKTKAFCGDPNQFGAAPNTLTSAISLGHPGTLPRANAKQVEYAAKLGLALGCSINQQSYFDRKNYFYPDLPKGYQVTQDNAPICLGGSIDIEVNGQPKTIQLTRIHMEEDAGKSIHDLSATATMIDLNRAGVPLLEVVTEPDLRSGEEAYALLNEFRKLVRYLGISDGNLEEGSLRCDCNISVRPFGQQEFGTRCEIKNVNSMRNAQKAIEYESRRQIRLIESGQEIEQQTRSFDAAKGDTETILRTKEDAHDYRYFPEPDLPIIHITDNQLAQWRAEQPPLPWELEATLMETHQLSRQDARTLTEDPNLVNYFFELSKHSGHSKTAANWILNQVKSWLNEQQQVISNFPLNPLKLAGLIQLVRSNQVNRLEASRQVFPAMILSPEKEAIDIATDLNLLIADNQDELENWIQAALEKYPDKVQAYRRGKKGLLGLFMGEIMKASKGKVDPKKAQQALRAALDQ